MELIKEHHIAVELENSLSPFIKNAPKELLIKPAINFLIFNAVTDWIVIITCWVLFFHLPIWLYPILALVIAARFHSFGVILHDAVHMPLKNKSIKFRILEILTGYPAGTTLNAMRYHHLRHHKDSGMPTDPYFKNGVDNIKWLKYILILRTSILVPFWTLRGLYGSLAFYLPLLRNSYARIFLQDKSGKDLINHVEVIQCASEDRWQLLFHVFFFSLTLNYPTFFIYCFLIPAIIAGIFAGNRLLNEHNYIETLDRKPETIINTTRDNHLIGLLKYFLAPRNIGYHIVHHLHPQVAWNKLPALRNWYVENYPHLYPKKNEDN